MSHVDRYPYVFTLNGWGGGTFTPNVPFNGFLVALRAANEATAWTNAGGAGGSVDISLVHGTDGGTVYSESNVTAPFLRFPARRVVNDAGGTTAYAVGSGPVVAGGVPVDDVVSLVISGGSAAVAGTLYASVQGNAR